MTTNSPITPVSTAPVTMSTFSSRSASALMRLSTAYDWMNESPHGAIVVPTTATAVINAPECPLVPGTTRPCSVAE